MSPKHINYTVKIFIKINVLGFKFDFVQGKFNRSNIKIHMEHMEIIFISIDLKSNLMISIKVKAIFRGVLS